MKKYYLEPEMTVRNYRLIPGNVVTTSGDWNLGDGDDENPWKKGSQSNLFDE